jgi:NADH dehydrogenase FAD-containing subunit
MGHVLKVDIRV